MRTFYTFAALALLVLALDHRWPGAVFVAAAIFAGWRADVEVHPFARCRKCKGTGLNPGSRPVAYGLCVHGPQRVRLFANGAAARHMKRRRA